MSLSQNNSFAFDKDGQLVLSNDATNASCFRELGRRARQLAELVKFGGEIRDGAYVLKKSTTRAVLLSVKELGDAAQAVQAKLVMEIAAPIPEPGATAIPTGNGVGNLDHRHSSMFLGAMFTVKQAEVKSGRIAETAVQKIESLAALFECESQRLKDECLVVHGQEARLKELALQSALQFEDALRRDPNLQLRQLAKSIAVLRASISRSIAAGMEESAESHSTVLAYAQLAQAIFSLPVVPEAKESILDHLVALELWCEEASFRVTETYERISKRPIEVIRTELKTLTRLQEEFRADEVGDLESQWWIRFGLALMVPRSSCFNLHRYCSQLSSNAPPGATGDAWIDLLNLETWFLESEQALMAGAGPAPEYSKDPNFRKIAEIFSQQNIVDPDSAKMAHRVLGVLLAQEKLQLSAEEIRARGLSTAKVNAVLIRSVRGAIHKEFPESQGWIQQQTSQRRGESWIKIRPPETAITAITD